MFSNILKTKGHCLWSTWKDELSWFFLFVLYTGDLLPVVCFIRDDDKVGGWNSLKGSMSCPSSWTELVPTENFTELSGPTDLKSRLIVSPVSTCLFLKFQNFLRREFTSRLITSREREILWRVPVRFLTDFSFSWVPSIQRSLPRTRTVGLTFGTLTVSWPISWSTQNEVTSLYTQDLIYDKTRVDFLKFKSGTFLLWQRFIESSGVSQVLINVFITYGLFRFKWDRS